MRQYDVHVQVTYDFSIPVKAKDAGQAEKIAIAHVEENATIVHFGASRAIDVVKVELENE